MLRADRFRWLLVVTLALMVNVSYGAIFYSFSVLLGEGAASEFSRALLSVALGLGVAVSGMLALSWGRSATSSGRGGSF